MTKTAVIIGAGPAGLTFAYELLEQTDIKPIIIELEGFSGGISRTHDYNGNKMDIGGHRFFSKSDKVMNWWFSQLPLDESEEKDDIMLIRNRLSRIYYLKKFFNYPVSLSFQTLKNLGFLRTMKIGFSYLKSLFVKRKENSLEDFFINRFGCELYQTFFKDYTQKVWGIECSKIPADWGKQRIKGISLLNILKDIITKPFKKKDISQKDTETSLIEQFVYPKYGPGHLWAYVADKIVSKGGKIIYNTEVTGVNVQDGRVVGVETSNGEKIEGDYFVSTMPVKDLIAAMGEYPPQNIKEIAKNLMYRDFRTVGLILKELKIKDNGKLIPDTWIYIQENDVEIGRLQVFNNWSPYIVKDKNTVSLGLEYFCFENDELWNMSEEEFCKFAASELEKIGIIDSENIIDSCSLKIKKAYPAYFGSYNEFDKIKDFTDKIENLYLIGRNGMHRYNNMDHSMMSAMEAVKNIKEGVTSKDNIWNVNTEDEYSEIKKK